MDDKIKSLGIQVENLCQFLPQDKVGDFAKMQPKDILRETLRARDPKLLKQHEELINFREETSKLQKTIEDQKSQVQELEIQFRQRKESMERYFERQKLIEKQSILKKKRPYIEYEKAREAYHEMQELLREAKEKYERILEVVQPQRENINRKEEQLKQVSTEKSKLSRDLEKMDTKRRELTESIEKFEHKTRECDQLLEKIREKAEKKEIEIKKHQEDINNLEDQLRNDTSHQLLDRKNEIREELEKHKQRYSLNQRKLSEIDQKIYPHYTAIKRTKEELSNLKNIRAQKLQRIKENNVR